MLGTLQGPRWEGLYPGASVLQLYTISAPGNVLTTSQ